jgi:YD repeat-containing protein
MAFTASQNGYAFQRAVVINHSLVSNTDQANFPVLISGTFSDLKTVANGGNVQSTQGYDIIFTSDAAGQSLLAFEQETYSGSTGAINFWVKVPILSHITDTIVYMFYGNSSVTTDQSNKAAVWDANYKGVWHLSNGTTLNANDSTTNANNGTVNGSISATVGKIDGAASSPGGTNNGISMVNSITTDASPFTYSFWVNSTGGGNTILRGEDSFGNGWSVLVQIDSTILFGIVNSAPAFVPLSSNATISTGTWYNIAAVWTPGSGMKLYVNGALDNSNTDTSNTLRSSSKGLQLFITNSSNSSFNGLLDEVEVSNTARSAGWIATEYNNQSSPATFAIVCQGQAVGGSVPPCSVVPAPSVAQLSPATGAAGTPVNITGANFGATQGSGVLRFNGHAAAINSWGTGSIQATAPVGVSTGPVTVTASGQTSNGMLFTAITTGTLGGTVTASAGGAPIAGATVQALQNGVVKSSGSTAVDGSYSLNNITGGIYDIQVSASSFGTGLMNFVSVPAGRTTTANVSLSTAATVSGSISQADGGTPIPGASIQLFAGSAPASKVTSDASGNYSSAGLNATSYTLQASATGFVTKSQTVTLVPGSATTINVALQATGVSPINYAYDELGRLISVSDSSGDTAVYQYDAVGNILSISRYATSQVSIVSFTPRTGPVGTSVVINGTGFSATASQNTVQFNGVAATVTSATSTQISTTVPSGATTGPITVTTPSGSAVSTSNYTVGAAAGAPTITGFQPSSATIGSPIAILGTNFYAAANNKLALNASRPYATSGTSTQINTIIPASTASGRVSVTTPDGTATGTQDFYIPFGAHQASDIGYTARFSFGNSQPVSLAAGKIALLLFDASAGQGASLQLSGSTFSSCTLYIFSPAGIQLTSSGCTNATTLVSSVGLPSTGTYTIGIDPGAGAGSISVSLAGDFVSTIAMPPSGQTGATVRVPPTGDLIAGQYGRITFTATAGQKVSVNVLTSTIGSTFNSCILTLYSPTNTQIAWWYCGSTGNFYMDTATLPTTGQYSLVVAPQGTATGNVSLSVNNDADVTGSISIDGSAVTIGTTVAGQDAVVTFSATAGQRIILFATNVTNASAGVQLGKPDGNNQADLGFSNNPSGQTFYMDTQTLVAPGTYRLWVQHYPALNFFGSQTLQIASVPPDVTGSVTIGGSAYSFTTVAGQNANITFSNPQTQSLTVNITNGTYPNTIALCGMYVTGPSPSTNQVGFTFCDGVTGTIGLGTQPAGTYNIFVDPVQQSAGGLSVTVTTP